MAGKPNNKKAAEKAAPQKKAKRKYQMWKLYEVQGGKIVRKNPFSAKAGSGFFMASHKDRITCGKTGYTEIRK
ncbi:MAG: 30S ribosomal protein S27ae [Candidatus Woesearchaeota archaeon]